MVPEVTVLGNTLTFRSGAVKFLSRPPSTPHELMNTNSHQRNILITDKLTQYMAGIRASGDLLSKFDQNEFSPVPRTRAPLSFSVTLPIATGRHCGNLP